MDNVVKNIKALHSGRQAAAFRLATSTSVWRDSMSSNLKWDAFVSSRVLAPSRVCFASISLCSEGSFSSLGKLFRYPRGRDHSNRGVRQGGVQAASGTCDPKPKWEGR